MRTEPLVRALSAASMLALTSWPLLAGQCSQEPEGRTLVVVAEKAMADSWRVSRADISECPAGIQTHLEVRNVSGREVSAGRFYAEYYDAKRRRCFSGIFDVSENLERRTDEMRPGETRTLFTSSYELFPGSEPTTVRVYPMSASPLRPAAPIGRSPGVSQPIRIGATSLKAAATWYHLCLGDVGSPPFPPILNLVLALVDVDSAGKVAGISVLRARSPQIEAWFREFWPHLRFLPGTESTYPQQDQTLLLVRAWTPAMHPGVVPERPWESEWVRDYTGRVADSEVPWVNVIVLDRPPKGTAAEMETTMWNGSALVRLCGDYYGTGTIWSLDTTDGGGP